MKAKLGGLLFALILLGLGGHMLYAPTEYADTKEMNTSGRRASYKRALVWAIDSIGVMPTALVLVGAGGLIGFVTLKPTRDSEG